MAHKHEFACIDNRGNLLCGQHAGPEDEWEDRYGPRYIVGERDTPRGRRVFVARPDTPGQELIAPEDLPQQRQTEIANAAHARRRREDAVVEKAQEAAALDVKRGLHGFTAGMPAVKARKIEETLDKLVSINKIFAKRREHVEDLVSKGWRIELSTYAATLGERRLTEPRTGDYLNEKGITKIAMDYAEHVSDVRFAARPPDEPDEPVPPEIHHLFGK